MNTAFGKQLKMKYCKIFLCLLLMILAVSTNAQEMPKLCHELFLENGFIYIDPSNKEEIFYSCDPGYKPFTGNWWGSVTCRKGSQFEEPRCIRQTTSCGLPPHVNDADTIELKKDEYTTGERVEYSCFSKYTLDLRPPFSRFLTCDQGEWRGNIKCLKPCTVTPEEMERRGIELAYGHPQKMFAPHNDNITFACKRGKYPVGVPLRQQCNDGVITLPECE